MVKFLISLKEGKEHSYSWKKLIWNPCEVKAVLVFHMR